MSPGQPAAAAPEITVFTEAAAGPRGRVTAGALPYLLGAAQPLSGTGEALRLNYVFTQGGVIPRGAPWERGAGGLLSFLKGAGLSAGWDGWRGWWRWGVLTYVFS